MSNKNLGTQEHRGVSETQRVKQTEDCPAALAVNARQAAAMLNVSVRQLWRLNSTGRLPRPIRLGHCVRWRRAELEAFVQAGAPTREKWEAIRHDSN